MFGMCDVGEVLMVLKKVLVVSVMGSVWMG